MTRTLRRTLGLALAILAAGCSDAPPPLAVDTPTPDAQTAADGRDLRTELAADDAVPAPRWRVGDAWTAELTYGSEPAGAVTYTMIVTDATSDEYHVATDDRQASKYDALYDYPNLGPVRAEDLALTGRAGPWRLVQFPLTDGATWTGEIPNIAHDVLPPGPVPLTFTATYDAALPSAGTTAPGYTIQGTLEDGTPLIDLTYTPHTAWFPYLRVYDIDPTDDPIEFTLHLTDVTQGWTGTYYVHERQAFLESRDEIGLDAPPPDGRPVVTAAPIVGLEVPDTATFVAGYIALYAVAGARALTLTSPDGVTREYQVVGAPEDERVTDLDEPAVPGMWQLRTAGAGGNSQGYAYLAALLETQGTL